MTVLSSKQPFNRFRYLKRGYLGFTLTTSVVFMVVAAKSFLKLTGFSLATRFNQLSPLLRIGFIPSMVIALVLGFLVGGWIWSRVAKKWLGVTAEEMRGFFKDQNRHTPWLNSTWLDRVNKRAIDNLYKKDQDRKQ